MEEGDVVGKNVEGGQVLGGDTVSDEEDVEVEEGSEGVVAPSIVSDDGNGDRADVDVDLDAGKDADREV